MQGARGFKSVKLPNRVGNQKFENARIRNLAPASRHLLNGLSSRLGPGCRRLSAMRGMGLRPHGGGVCDVLRQGEDKAVVEKTGLSKEGMYIVLSQ